MKTRLLTKSARHELYRKTVHLTSLWIPLLIGNIRPLYSATVLLVLTVADFFIEYLYHRKNAGLSRFIKRRLIKMMRYPEINPQNFTPSGSLCLLISAFCAVILFNPPVACTAVTILIIADSAAAVIGKIFGTIKLPHNKTLEGSVAFFIITTLILQANFYNLPLAGARIISISALLTLTELLAPLLKLDDNFIIPVTAGVLLSV